jgi:exodeoxyribonuclease VII small subunit
MADRNNENEEDIVIEDAFARLDEINAKLESKDTSLKDALDLYSEGFKLAAACRKNLEGVEKEIRIINEV